MRFIEDIVDPRGSPPWLSLLSPIQKAWREKQILKGRNPDEYIRDSLKEAGKWPPKKARAAKKTKSAKRS